MHECSEGAAKGLRVYKIRRLCGACVNLDSILQYNIVLLFAICLEVFIR